MLYADVLPLKINSVSIHGSFFLFSSKANSSRTVYTLATHKLRLTSSLHKAQYGSGLSLHTSVGGGCIRPPLRCPLPHLRGVGRGCPAPWRPPFLMLEIDGPSPALIPCPLQSSEVAGGIVNPHVHSRGSPPEPSLTPMRVNHTSPAAAYCQQ